MADDVASLGFAVDSAELVAASAALDKVNESAQRLVPSQAAVANASQRLLREQQLTVGSARAVTRAQAELGDKIDLLTRNTEQAYRSLSTRSFFRLLAREASLVGGPLGQMIGHFGILTVGGQRLGGVITGVTIAFAAVVAAVATGIAKFAELEKQQHSVAAALELTRVASGQNVAGLERMAQRMGDTGNVTLISIREAQAELLKFKTVGVEAFEPLLEVAKKVSLTGFADMKTAARVLAESLKEPGTAMERLKEIMITLTAAQQAEIDKALRNSDVMKAHAIILAAAATATAGVSDSSNTLSSAWERLHNSFFGRLIEVGEMAANFLRLRDAMNSIADMLRNNFGGSAPLRITVHPAVGGISEEDERRRRNQEELAKAAAKVNLELDKQLLVAGKSAVQLEQYNQTVEKNIAAETKEAAAIRSKVSAIAAINETRRVTDQIKLNTAELKIETQTMTMATGPAAEYRAVQDAIAQAKIKNIELSASQIEAIKKEAAAFGQAKAEAERLRQAIDMSGAFVSGFFTDLSHGVKAIDALKNALTRLSDTLIDMISRRLVAQALGGLLGGGASSPIDYVGGNPIYSAGGLSPLDAAVRHSGGMADFGGVRRYVHPAYFDNAPRFARGGIVGNEVPVIAHPGERISTPEQWAAQGRGGGDTHTYYIDASGADSAAISRLQGALMATNAKINFVDKNSLAHLQQKHMLEG